MATTGVGAITVGDGVGTTHGYGTVVGVGTLAGAGVGTIPGDTTVGAGVGTMATHIMDGAAVTLGAAIMVDGTHPTTDLITVEVMHTIAVEEGIPTFLEPLCAQEIATPAI